MKLREIPYKRKNGIEIPKTGPSERVGESLMSALAELWVICGISHPSPSRFWPCPQTYQELQTSDSETKSPSGLNEAQLLWSGCDFTAQFLSIRSSASLSGPWFIFMVSTKTTTLGLFNPEALFSLSFWTLHLPCHLKTVDDPTAWPHSSVWAFLPPWPPNSEPSLCTQVTCCPWSLL